MRSRVWGAEGRRPKNLGGGSIAGTKRGSKWDFVRTLGLRPLNLTSVRKNFFFVLF